MARTRGSGPRLPLGILCAAWLLAANSAVLEAAPPRTLLTGPYDLPDEAFLAFAERLRPDLVVLGTFGPPQWAAQQDPAAWVEKWRGVCARLHRAEIKVVGMIELLNVGNDVAQAERFAELIDRRWDEKLLGPRPPVTGASLFERRRLPAERQVSATAPRACAANPHWPAVMEALLRPLLAAGLDGFITHRNMYGECGCPFCHAEFAPANQKPPPAPHGHKHPDHKHPGQEPPGHKHAGDEGAESSDCAACRAGFRAWLASRYEPRELEERFGVRNLNGHAFPPLAGQHREHERLPTPLELEALKFTRHAVKETFDEIFVRRARRLKPDLLVAQWNHLPVFDELHLDRGHAPPSTRTSFVHASADERFGLPLATWGRGEDFFWYCNWGTCQNTQLERRFVGDITLYAKLLRSLARGRPYLINKYDFYRPRNMLAEAAGLGMLVAGKDLPYQRPEDAAVAVRFFDFLRAHADLFEARNGTEVADATLVFPRLATHAGRADALEMVEAAGRTLIVDHVPFELVTDDLLASGQATLDPRRQRVLIVADPVGLPREALRKYQAAGGRIVAVPANAQDAAAPLWQELQATVVAGLAPHSGGTPAADPLRRAWRGALAEPSFACDAPYTVETHLYRAPGRVVAHLVNYDRREQAPGGSVSEREAPRAAPACRVRLRLGEGERPRRATFLDPDATGPRELPPEVRGYVVELELPAFLSYGVCLLELGE